MANKNVEDDKIVTFATSEEFVQLDQGWAFIKRTDMFSLHNIWIKNNSDKPISFFIHIDPLNESLRITIK